MIYDFFCKTKQLYVYENDNDDEKMLDDLAVSDE